MSIFTEQAVRTRARSATAYKSASALFSERMRSQATISEPDIFLSHSFEDRELLLGAVLMIEDLRYRVYLDWRDDPTVNRTEVTPGNAAMLRERMTTSRCLFYAVTPHATDSLWTKWELGYKDGNNGKIAILPIIGTYTDAYSGPQFLGLYPYVTIENNKRGEKKLWIHDSATCYVEFSAWLAGTNPSEH